MSSNTAPVWVARTLAGLSLDQKIGQLLFLHDSDRVAIPGGWTDTVVRLVTAGRAGGIYPGPLQLRSPRQTAELNNRLQSLAPVARIMADRPESGTVAAGVVELIRQLSSAGKPVIVLALGSPYEHGL